MRKAISWTLDHWYIPVLILAAVVGFFAFRRWRPGEDPFKRVKEELGIIQAGTDARNMAIQLGAEQAKAHVKDKYQAKLAALDAQQQTQVKELEDDPVALARYLERLSR
jgi:hypothetical protein